MSKLVPPHGSSELKPLLLEGKAREEEIKKAATLMRVPMTSRETGDLIMMGIGAFTPLDGFMGKDDWQQCCDSYALPSHNGLFWPIPITLSAADPLNLVGIVVPGDRVPALSGNSVRYRDGIAVAIEENPLRIAAS